MSDRPTTYPGFVDSDSDHPMESTPQPALDAVHVPPGHLPIEVVQFWRGQIRRGFPHPLHWAIHVRTSTQRGNTHEIVGDMDTFATQDRFDVALAGPEDDTWRGGHVVGYVSPARLDDLLNRVALVPVIRHRWGWNCQNWVYEVLEGLGGRAGRDSGLYVDPGMTFGKLQKQMWYLLEAWEVGDI